MTQVHIAGRDAPWRHNRFSNDDFVLMQIRRGRRICPLLSIPGVTILVFRDDWLHSVDQGVGADFLVNLFVLIMNKFPGSKPEKAMELWRQIQIFYDAHHVQDKLKSFDWNNVWGDAKKPPKLRGGNASSVRALFLFGNEIAQRMLDDSVPEEDAAKRAAHHLLMCYQSLRTDATCKHDVLYNSSISFALQYNALNDLTPEPLWRVKPKMHRFLEMCSQDCVPSLFWTYRDEDFGGTVGHQSKMRGRWKQTLAYMQHALDMFAMKNPEPRLL